MSTSDQGTNGPRREPSEGQSRPEKRSAGGDRRGVARSSGSGGGNGGTRPDRGQRTDRGDRPARSSRDTEGPGGDRPSYRGRDESRGERPDRPAYREGSRTRGDRPAYRGRDESRGERPARPSYRDGDASRGERPARAPYRDGDSPRGDRPAYRGRDDSRGERSGFRDGDRRPARTSGPRSGDVRRPDDRGERAPDRSGRPLASRERPDADRTSRPPQHARADRPIAPEVPDDVLPTMLDRQARTRLRTLSKDNSDGVARHLVMAGRLVDTDPELAYAHAQAAVRRAGRVDVVREAAGLTAYHAGHYADALRELRAARRLSGSEEHLAVMADCERGLGRPDRALAVAAEPGATTLPLGSRIELALVVAGARLDLGDPEAALVSLATADVDRATGDLADRVAEVRATALEAAGRSGEASELRTAHGLDDTEDEDPVVVFDLDDEDDDAEPRSDVASEEEVVESRSDVASSDQPDVVPDVEEERS